MKHPKSIAALLLLSAAAAAQTTPAAQHAAEAYLAGARLLDHKDLAAAQQQFARASQLDPTHSEYALAATLTREHRVSDLIRQAALARMTNHVPQADTLLAEARAIDPNDELVLQHDEAEPPVPIKTTPQITFAGPVVLEPTPGLEDLHLRGDAKTVVTRAATAYGIRTVFNESVTGQNDVRFDLEQTPYTQAMPILLRMTHLFAVPVDAHTLLIAKDTEENRGKLERQIEESIYIPGSTTEQLNELTNIIKNVFDVKQVTAALSSGTLLVRAPEPTLKAVNYTLADMLDGGAEVMLEIKLVTVDKSLTRTIGASPPTSFSAFSAAAEAQSFVTANQSLINSAISSGKLTYRPGASAIEKTVEAAAFLIGTGLATDAKLSNIITFFGGGLTLFATSIGSGGTFDFGLNSSESHALEDITVRIGDRQTTTLRIGEKYPITTATYSSGISSSTASALSGASINGQSVAALLKQYTGGSGTATVPQVQFEDLGLTLKTTPSVQRGGLINLNIDLKLEALTGTSLNNIPVLTSSNFTSDITVQEGKTVIMLSDVSRSQANSISGYPGLGELPGFQDTLSQSDREGDSSELIMLITPHLVRRRNNAMASKRFPFSSSVPADN